MKDPKSQINYEPNMTRPPGVYDPGSPNNRMWEMAMEDYNNRGVPRPMDLQTGPFTGGQGTTEADARRKRPDMFNDQLQGATKMDPKAISALAQRANLGDPQAREALGILDLSFPEPNLMTQYNPSQIASMATSGNRDAYNYLQTFGQDKISQIANNNPEAYDLLKRNAMLPGQKPGDMAGMNSAAVKQRQNNAAPKRTGQPGSDAKPQAPASPIIVGPSNPMSAIRAQGDQILIQPQNPTNRISASGPGPQKPQQATPTRQPARPAASGPAKKPPGGGGGGGGRRGGGSKPPLTAKQRNAMADEAASKAARRADSRGISDSAYRNANQDSATWLENETARRERLEKAGLNPDYEGWKDNPNYEKDVADANKRAWDNFNNNQKEQEKQAARKKVADDYKEALKQGGFTDDLGNWHDAKNPDGSASNALLGHTQKQRKMVHAYGNKHSSVMVAARPGNP